MSETKGENSVETKQSSQTTRTFVEKTTQEFQLMLTAKRNNKRHDFVLC